MTIGIIGGGPAGLFAALHLKARAYNVLLIEALVYTRPRVGEHLAAEALHEFRKLGIPEKILLENSRPCAQVINAWGSNDLHENESIFNPFGNGFVLTRPDFDRALMLYAKASGVEVKTGTRVLKTERINKGWKFHLEDGARIVDFIVDASGRNSKFKPDKQVFKEVKDHLIGISACLKPLSEEPFNENGLLVESVAEGWWYSVQLAAGEWVGTFMTDARILTGSGLQTEAFWQKQLAASRHTQKRLFGKDPAGKVTVQSAHSMCLNRTYGEDWLATGDAAQSYDPLSSAGIIKGFKMGALAAQKLDEWHKGKLNALREYDGEVQRQFEEYLSARKDFYSQEKRFAQQPFWYNRNLWPREISHFTVHPGAKLKVDSSLDEHQQNLFKERLPEINFKTLLAAIRQNQEAGEAISTYLSGSPMPEFMLHALESLILLGVVRTYP